MPVRSSKKFAPQAKIVTQLRERIVGGSLRPGARLSTRLELAEQFDTTVVTVQRALTKLTEEGFVTANGWAGTFVSRNPPHLSHYGLVFGYRPNEPAIWAGLERAMREAAFAIGRTEALRLSTYFYSGFEPHKTEDYDRLVEGVLKHTVAGLIFVESPHRLRSSPVLLAPGIPRVAIMSEAVIPGVAAVYVDHRAFFDRALDYLHARGRRRVAILSTQYKNSLRDYVIAAVARRGMELPPYAWLSVAGDEGGWARNVAHVLLRSGQSEHPDALIIADDILVESASAGIAASGAVVGRDLDVVAHCNYPTVPAKVLPIRFLGFDSERLLRTCIEHVDRMRRGETTVDVALIPPRFEDEPAEIAVNSELIGADTL